jgi:hypothetical protein
MGAKAAQHLFWFKYRPVRATRLVAPSNRDKSPQRTAILAAGRWRWPLLLD